MASKTNLTGSSVASTYTQLLHIGDDNGVEATEHYVVDGNGTASALSLGTTAVGIGTDDPDADLSVQTSTNSDTTYGVSFKQTSGATQGGIAINAGGTINIDGNNNLALATGGTRRMLIDSSGNVGINVTSPEDKLHIAGATASVSDTQLVLEGRYGGYGAGINFVSRTSSGGTNVSMAKITADGENSFNTTTNTQDAGLRFFTTLDGTSAEKMRIDSSGNTRPGADNSYDIGTASYRWDDVYATNGTIQTSDERMKDNIATSSIGLNFVNQLNPVEYKWKDYDYEEEVSPAVEAKDEIAWGDELPTDENTKDEIKAFMDSYGFEYNSGDTKSDLLDKIPSVKEEAVEAKDAVFETKTKTFSRKHYGLIAQEVEQVLTDSGIEREDFAPLIYDEDSDRYGMRYGEMVGILVKAVQELSAKVEALENE